MADVSLAFSGYRIIRLLGSGGTARVFLATKKDDDRYYALKVPLHDDAESSLQFLSLIEREYQLIGQYTYPGLVRIIGLDEVDQPLPFLTMEYCPGTTLDKVDKIDSVDALLNIISSVSINLFYLKLVGLSHGDLKPHNIFLTTEIEEYSGNHIIYTKISDFSLALKSNEEKADRLGIGTIGYIAPETAEYNTLDHKSDIFSLGITAYWLATGKHPFMEDEKDPVRINSLIKEFHPPPPIEINDALPEGLSDLIMTMLEKEPESRPQDSFEICERLSEIGSKYPFEKMIRPKHLIDIANSVSNETILNEDIFAFGEDVTEKLLNRAGNDKAKLRNVLEVNFTRNLLKWQSGKLYFDRDAEQVILPHRVQKWNRVSFHRLPYSSRKRIILTSIAGGLEEAASIGMVTDPKQKELITRPHLHYVGTNISKATLRRFANRLAETASNIFHNELLAARLYIKAGNIEKGYSITLDAANLLINRNSYQQAIDLLRALEALCREKNDIAKLRIALMEIGDIEKTIGEASRAEQTYMKIIELYEGCPTDRLLAETYKDLGDLYKIKQEYEEGIKALRKAERLYTELDDQLELSHTLNNIGNILSIDSQYGDALVNYRKALKIQRRLKVGIDVASTLSNMAAIFYIRGRYERTLRLFSLALALQREIGNAGEIARTLNNLGFLYYDMGNFDSAMDALNESMALNRQIGSKKELLFNLENMTTIMLSAGRLKDALGLLKEGMTLSGDLGDKPHKAILTSNMAAAQKRMGYYGQAMQSINHAIELIKEIDDDYNLINALIELADLYFRLNDRENAVKTADSVLNLASKNNDKKALILYHILRGEFLNDIESMNEAISIAEKINAGRIGNIARLKLTKLLISNEDYKRGLTILDELSRIFVEGNSDIQNACFFNLSGTYRQATGDMNEAKACFERGYRLATASALLPEAVDAAANLGMINSKMGDHETSFKYYRKALNGLKTIADDIKDEDLKKSFLSDGKIASMAGEIKKLSILLGQKKKAGT